MNSVCSAHQDQSQWGCPHCYPPAKPDPGAEAFEKEWDDYRLDDKRPHLQPRELASDFYLAGYRAGQEAYVPVLTLDRDALREECAAYRAENAALKEEVAENYSDLLAQMDEAWGNAQTIGRVEINAFLDSRRVHRPTMRLRKRLAAAEQRAEKMEKALEEITSRFEEALVAGGTDPEYAAIAVSAARRALGKGGAE